MPILVMVDHVTDMMFSSVVPQKGVNPYAVMRVSNDLSLLGHVKLVLKSDNEASILSLKQAVRAESSQQIEVSAASSRPRSEQIIPEESPAYDSASNGKVEVNIKLVQGHIRTLKSALESRLQQEIPDDHDCLPWLVRHSSWIRNRFAVKHDGRTAYERWKGKSIRKEVVEFGEQVMYLNQAAEVRISCHVGGQLECFWA